MADSANYDPVEYWNDRPNPNRRGQVPLAPGMRIWDYMTRHIEDGASLFELGPGIGRLFGLYRGHTLNTLDLSQRYQDSIASAAAKNEVNVTQQFSDDPLAPFPFEDDAFDLAIAVQVLIHIPYEHVGHTLSELGRVSRKALIISSHAPGWPNAPCEAAASDYCFNHEYFIALSEMGFEIDDVRIFRDAKHFVYR